MTFNRPVDRRGREIRRALLAVVRACEHRHQLLPKHIVLGLSLGIDRSQVSRHLARLRAEGAYVAIQGPAKRVFVSTVRNQHLRRVA
jgi:DNA-binding MarR family transcriptional regulator